MKYNKKIYFVGGNRKIEKGGGANVSLSALEKELTKSGYKIIPVGYSSDKTSSLLSFGRLPHISFNPLISLRIHSLLNNWKDSIIIASYTLRTTLGLARLKHKDSVIINNGHWCLNADVVVVRFLQRSYINKLQKQNLYNQRLSMFDIKSKVICMIEERMLLNKKLKYIIALSKESKKDLIQSYPTIRAKIVVIPNGVDKKRFKFSQQERSKVRIKLGINKDAKVILFIGGNIFRKNLDLVIKVFRVLKSKYHLIVVVKQNEVEAARKLTSKTKNISIISWGGNIVSFYSASDILLFPTYYDTGTKVVLESLVNGLYCIVSNFSGVGEYISKGEGLVVLDYKVGSYLDAVSKLNRRNLTNRLKSGNKVLDWEKVGESWFKILSNT